MIFDLTFHIEQAAYFQFLYKPLLASGENKKKPSKNQHHNEVIYQTLHSTSAKNMLTLP